MKRFLYLTLIPIGLFAQIPDTVISNTTYKLPCIISRFEDTRVLVDEKNGLMIVNLAPNITQIWLTGKGIVYTKSDGYVARPRDLNQFLKEREKLAKKERSRKQKSIFDRWNRTVKIDPDSGKTEEIIPCPAKSQIPHASIGIQVSPLNFYTVTSIYTNGEDWDEELMYHGAASVGSDFSWCVTKKLSIVGEIVHSQAKDYQRYKRFYQYSSSDDESRTGYKRTIDLSIWRVAGSLKWSLFAPRPKRVSPFLLAGLGKQFASYDYKYEDLYEESSSSSYTTKTNDDEFTEDMNSPFFWYAGYGAEYFFNDVFSVFTQVRYTHHRIQATYRYERKNTTTGYLRTTETKIDRSETRQDIALGLNFYF